jgi:hypothetical protein
MSRLLRAGSSAVLLLAIMFIGSLALWVGIPLAWLWVGSQIEAETDSVGAAFAAALVGVIVSIGLVIPVLSWLSDRHRAVRLARGLQDSGHLALEVVLVTSAGVAVVGFLVWFFLFSGAEAVPLGMHL